MLYLDLTDNKKYSYILKYILKECDDVTFHFPILDKNLYSTKELADDYKLYIDEKQKLLKELFAHGAKQHKSKTYLESKLGFETQIIRVRLYHELIERLKLHHLFEWLWWNGLPEDPCFFSGGE